MIATCTGCGKQLKVRDELVGKKLRCPGCGATFEASSAAPAGTSATRYDPKNKLVKEKGAGVAISWGPILGIGAVVLVVLGIILFIVGPVSVKNEWEKIGGKARDDVEEVVSKGVQAHQSAVGDWNPRKPGNMPRALDETIFIRPIFVMSMQEKIFFKGATTEGGFSGYYNPKTGQVDADVGLGGVSLTGLGAIKEGTQKIKVTGAMKGSEAAVMVDGKPAVIVYPPEEKD
ncbi:MAG: hypothetical protein H7Z14_05395 [Anaerolineae bacterium]|nr:hypothetical protein [Phycisphaerae bacterium]